MAKKWGPGNPLWDYWNKKKGKNMGKKGKQSKGSSGGSKGGSRSKAKKMFTIPLATFIQACIILEQATGFRVDDIVLPLVDWITGQMPTEVFKARFNAYLRSVITYIVQNPSEVAINTALAVTWTTIARRLLAGFGVPKRINVINLFYLEVR